MICISRTKRFTDGVRPLEGRLGLAPTGSKGRRRRRVLARDGYRCVYCGRDLLRDVDSLLQATIDHVVPKSLGGTNGEGNLVASCRTCNTLKDDTAVCDLTEGRAVIARRRAQATAALVESIGRCGHRRADQPIVSPKLERATLEIVDQLLRQAETIAEALRCLQPERQHLILPGEEERRAAA